MPPRQAPPAGFAWPITRSGNPPYNSVTQGHGAVGTTTAGSAIGTDGAAPCIAIYIRTSANGTLIAPSTIGTFLPPVFPILMIPACYVAHIDSDSTLTSADVPALKSLVTAKLAQHGLASATEWFAIGGQTDRYFAEGVMTALQERFGVAGLLDRAQAQNYNGFVVEFPAGGGDQKLLFTLRGIVDYSWSAVATATDGWSLRKVSGALTF